MEHTLLTDLSTEFSKHNKWNSKASLCWSPWVLTVLLKRGATFSNMVTDCLAASRRPVDSPHKGPAMRREFPCYDITMVNASHCWLYVSWLTYRFFKLWCNNIQTWLLIGCQQGTSQSKSVLWYHCNDVTSASGSQITGDPPLCFQPFSLPYIEENIQIPRH